ncbi:MAG TPA: Spy/CpxP family protein refolding chaperone [Longimicrobium sp.]|jgi:hypothetical protein|nr:Spy/CpxP family protein refolding chaperone [Longimicrobium sp.]
MKIRIPLAAVLLLAACGGRQTQDGPQPAGSGRLPRDSVQRELFLAYRGAQMPSVFGLIGARERLKLTSAQVTALDSIAQAVREQNRPLTESLRETTRSGNGGPIRQPRSDEERQEFISLLRRAGENTRRGVAGVQAVLNAEQRAAACALALEERRQRSAYFEPRGAGGGRGGRRGRGMMGDSIGGWGMGSAGWPWCGEMRPRGMRPDSNRADATRP